MARQRKSRKIVCLFVYLLHEWYGRKDYTFRFENSVNLGNNSYRIKYVFEHCMNDHRIERLILKRQIVPVTEDVYICTRVDVCKDALMRKKMRGNIVAPLAAADNKNITMASLVETLTYLCESLRPDKYDTLLRNKSFQPPFTARCTGGYVGIT